VVDAGDLGLLGEVRVRLSEVDVTNRRDLETVRALTSPFGTDAVSLRSPTFYQRLAARAACEEAGELLGRLAKLKPRPTFSPARHAVLDRLANRLGVAAGALFASIGADLYRGLHDLVGWVATTTLRELGEDVPATREPPLGTDALLRELGHCSRDLVCRPLELDSIAIIALRCHSLRRLGASVVAPLGGGALVAPTVALLRGDGSWDWVLASIHDAPGPIRLGPLSSTRRVAWIADDNVGSGRTATAIASVLAARGVGIRGVIPVELHWEKLVRLGARARGDSVWATDTVVPSPFAYLHYSVRRELKTNALAGQIDPRTWADWIISSRALVERALAGHLLGRHERATVEDLLGRSDRIARGRRGDERRAPREISDAM
jgi:hypothetical protein